MYLITAACDPARCRSIGVFTFYGLSCVVLFAWLSNVHAQDDAPPIGNVLNWETGPRELVLGSVAQIKVSDEFQVLGDEGTKTFLELTGNPVSGTELGVIAPTSDDEDWVVIFEFSPVGYVRDDEKDRLDADAMLTAIREGNEQANKERRTRGWPVLEILGWEQPPRYDPVTNNLEWAILAVSDGQQVVNYNTRFLGRAGVMEAALVVDPTELSDTIPKFKTLLTGFQFVSGMQYADFRSGDKIAKYGLTALVTGGAATVAVKTGLFKKIWKLLVVAVLAGGAFLKKIFGGGGQVEAKT